MKSNRINTEVITFITLIVIIISVIVATAEENTQEAITSTKEEPDEQEQTLFMSIEEELPDKTYECVRLLPNGEEIEFHHYNDRTYKESTCTEKGTDDYYCDACEKHIHIDYPLKDHCVVNDVCSFCGKDLMTIIEDGAGYYCMESTDEETSENINVQEMHQEEEQTEEYENKFNLISAYENYKRMPSEYMKERYLASLSDENRQKLLDYFEEQSLLEAETGIANE